MKQNLHSNLNYRLYSIFIIIKNNHKLAISIFFLTFLQIFNSFKSNHQLPSNSTSSFNNYFTFRFQAQAPNSTAVFNSNFGSNLNLQILLRILILIVSIILYQKNIFNYNHCLCWKIHSHYKHCFRCNH